MPWMHFVVRPVLKNQLVEYLAAPAVVAELVAVVECPVLAHNPHPAITCPN
jgi:hypothetical protein